VRKEKISPIPIHSRSNKLSPLESFINCEFSDASINERLSLEQRGQLCETPFEFEDAFATADKPLGAIRGHEVSGSVMPRTDILLATLAARFRNKRVCLLFHGGIGFVMVYKSL